MFILRIFFRWKALDRQSNIVCQTFEFPHLAMFERLATSQDIVYKHYKKRIRHTSCQIAICLKEKIVKVDVRLFQQPFNAENYFVKVLKVKVFLLAIPSVRSSKSLKFKQTSTNKFAFQTNLHCNNLFYKRKRTNVTFYAKHALTPKCLMKPGVI